MASLFPWLEEWKLELQGWARDGSLAVATQQALNLDGVPLALQRLIEQWSEAQWQELPPVELLNSEAMSGAAGAYAISTGTIYLNQHWLEGASAEHVRAVLTEELGHHLDGLLNAVDTPGDEGDRLAQLLLGGTGIQPDQSNDQLQLRVKDQWITAEAAETLAPPSQPDLSDDSDSGVSNDDGLTNDSNPTFRGTAEPGKTVKLFADGLSLGSTSADSNGNWIFSVPEASALGDGSYAITAVALDEATPATVKRTPMDVASSRRTHQETSNSSAFAALKEDGSVVTWGDSDYGGNSSAVSAELQSGVTQIFSNHGAFAALKEDGLVVTWGQSGSGGNSSAVSAELQSGVTQIFSTQSAFAALKEDGSVVTWGSDSVGGNSSAVSAALQSGVTQIFSHYWSFAALKEDGSVITWGLSDYGGNSSAVSGALQSGVTQIFSNHGAFAALKEDGSVVTWGVSDFGGNSSAVSAELQSGVSQIFAAEYAFAALKEDGSVVTWGNSPYGSYGGDSSAVSAELLSGVAQIFSNYSSFAALKEDGSVVTWGDSDYGGNSSAVSAELQSGVTQIFSTGWAFAALKEDGSVVTWGGDGFDSWGWPTGGGDSSGVSDVLQSGVTQIFSTDSAFAALKEDGSVVTWGSGPGGDSSSVSTELKSGVTQIFSNWSAFAALKEDGSVVTWGDSDLGGNSSAVSAELQSGVVSFADPFHDDRLIPASTLSSDPSTALAITIDTTAPLFTSESTAAAIDENSGSGQIIYTAAAADSSNITYSLKLENNDDADSFGINSTTGEVKLTADPDYESQASYGFTVVATDAAGNTAEQDVTLGIHDLDERPAPPSQPALSEDSDSGVFNDDGLTNDSTPTFRGTAEPGNAVELFADGISLGSTTADGNGNWTYSVPEASALGDGSYAITAVARDEATPATVQRTPIAVAFAGRTHQEWGHHTAFAALKQDGSVVTWGNSEYGGDSSGVSDALQSGVTQIFSNLSAFAALKEDGSVVTWGNSPYGSNGGDSSAVSAELQSGVTQIFSTYSAFAALKEDGSVVTWGRPNYGGNSSSVSAELQSGVTQIFSTHSAFAALKEDGSVVTWGNSDSGGDGGIWSWDTNGYYQSTGSNVSSELQTGVTQIFSTHSAFAALKEDGSVVTWGNSGWGGDRSSVSAKLQSSVTQVFSNLNAFAALKDDGSVITWGGWGGDSSAVRAELQSDVTQIFSSYLAFAALKQDGSVVTWGHSAFGGDSSGVSDALQSGVTQIFSSRDAFAALKEDGSVVTWGDSDSGGDSSGVSDALQLGVKQIFSNDGAFAALKADGSVVTWGDSSWGGDSSAVSDALQSGVTQIFSTEFAFAALKEDGSVVTWGLSEYGGNSSGVSDALQSGVVAFADPFHDDRLIPATTGSGLSSEPSLALAIMIDTTAPLFSSDGSAEAIDENSGSGQIVYTAAAADALDITYSLKFANNDDAESFSINSTTGEVRLTADPDYESQASYGFTVVATDAAGNTAEQEVSLAVEDAQPVGPKLQQISTPRTTIPYVPGSLISIPLIYSTGNNDNTLFGLTLDVHYDSSLLTPAGDKTNNYGVTGLADADYSFVIRQPDEQNTDGDSSTDEVLRLSWFSMDKSFPGTQLPDVIANLTFNTIDEAGGADPITGSAIRLTPVSQPYGFDFAADPLTLQPTPFSLDVDGDGMVNLYTDGIMIIRRLISLETCTSGFGDDYFNTNNRYSAEQIDALLDESYAAGMFDFDQNSNTSLYTDGILLIRYLISPYLIADSAEIIAPDSPFKTNPEGLIGTFESLMAHT